MGNNLDFSVETKMFRATVLRAKMLQYQAQKNRTNHKWLQYVNSTSTRFNFAAWIVHSYYADRRITASIIQVEMGVSRKAIDEMVNDWLAEDWLYKEKGEGMDSNKYFLHPTEQILLLNNEWFEWYEEVILPDMMKTFYVLQNSKVSYKNLKDKVSFNPLHTTNLSGIDNKVTSFILKNDEKQRSRRNK
jgi:hypothetical protein